MGENLVNRCLICEKRISDNKEYCGAHVPPPGSVTVKVNTIQITGVSANNLPVAKEVK